MDDSDAHKEYGHPGAARERVRQKENVMSVLGLFHQLWANEEGLFELLRSRLPADRVVTGIWKADEDVPYATLNIETDSPEFRSSCGRQDSALVRLQIWHTNYDEGLAIKDAAIAAFDGVVRQGDGVPLVQFSSGFDLEEDDGTWQFLADFTVQH